VRELPYKIMDGFLHNPERPKTANLSRPSGISFPNPSSVPYNNVSTQIGPADCCEQTTSPNRKETEPP